MCSERVKIRTNINLPYVEGKTILRSHKIRSTFYTKSTLRKFLCKLKGRVATEDKSNIVYEIHCSKISGMLPEIWLPNLQVVLSYFPISHP